MNTDPALPKPEIPGDDQAPSRIVLVVVVTLAALCVLYMATLAACILAGLQPNEKVLLQFVAGGTYVLGVLSGILVNPHPSPSPRAAGAPLNAALEANSASKPAPFPAAP